MDKSLLINEVNFMSTGLGFTALPSNYCITSKAHRPCCFLCDLTGPNTFTVRIIGLRAQPHVDMSFGFSRRPASAFSHRPSRASVDATIIALSNFDPHREQL